MEFITIRQREDLIEKAANWFSSKWHIDVKEYLKCMNAYIKKETEYGWYLCIDNNDIVAGLGVIDNDFHQRKDLTPNICAVYTEKQYRNKGIAKKLLNMAVDDLKRIDVSPVYLITDHTDFYEKCGWQFYGNIKDDSNNDTRMYVHY